MAAEAVGTAFAEKIVGCVVDPVSRQFGYLFNYDDNIAILTKKLVKLEDMREELQQRVDAAQRNSEPIKNDVMRWLEQAKGQKKVEAEQIVKDCNEKVGKGFLNRWCLSLKSRYSLSKKALKKSLDLDKFLEDGHFEGVAHPKLPLGIVPASTASTSSGTASAPQVEAGSPLSSTSHKGFESRLSIMSDIIETLKDDNIHMLRICGMGGVGKTTMAKEVEKVVRDESLFHEIAKAEFTHHPDVARIQDYLAESVGLKLNEGDLSARAIQICERLNDKTKKILLILDNVWRREDLEQVGIPLDEEKMNCKIFLTSRSEDVCADLRSQKLFRIGFLSDQEARDLFQSSVGSTSYARMHKIAENIVNECGGLPLAITTIGRALANKSKPTWENVLGHLKKSTRSGENAAVFNSVEVSYDFLELEEMKECFLLCSSFPEGVDVPIEDLVRYSLALRLFQNIDSVLEARTRTHAHVEKLLHSNLLLATSMEECVKMHDLVRDFALSTACKGLYMVRYGNSVSRSMEWPTQDTHEHYTLISLQCGQMDELPDRLDCPNLKLLKLVTDTRSPKFPKDFYKGMSALNILAFSRMFVPVPPKSTKLLVNLRTLSINGIENVCNISTIANLENLEVLSLAGSRVEQFPRENGIFNRLKLLDLTHSRIVDGFPPSILLGLIRLEELYVRYSSGLYSSAEEEKSFIAEIKSLSALVVLDIEIQYGVLPKDFPLGNLERFNISGQPGSTTEKLHMLSLLRSNYTYQFKNTLRLRVDKNVLLQVEFKALLRKTDILDLEVIGLICFDESEGEDLPNLEILSLQLCFELVYLVKTMELRKKNVFPNLHSLHLSNLSNLEAIYHVEHSKTSFTEIEVVPDSFHSMKIPTKLASFGNLRVVDVTRCNKLEYVFSLSIARGLVFLERLEIIECKMMTTVFSKESGDENDQEKLIMFPRIKHLKLDRLPKLTSLFADRSSLGQQVNASNMEPLFNQKGPYPATGFQSLRSIVVKSCCSLRQLFAPSTTVLFRELQNLKVKSCEALQSLVATDNECPVEGILFPLLNSLRLSELPNLLLLMPITCSFNWLSLKKLKLNECGGDSDLFANMSGLQKDASGQKIASTSLEDIEIRKMNLNMLWSNPFPARCSYKLKKIRLANSDIPTISHPMIQGFDHLEQLELNGCNSLEIAFELEEFSVVPLSQLRNLDIRSMKSMTQIWKIGRHGFQGFQNLTSLCLFGCNSITYLLSPFIAKYLVNLEDIVIASCMKIEEVLSNREKVEEQFNATVAHMVSLPKLDTVHLWDLPSLVCIGPLDFATETTSFHHQNTATTSNEKGPKYSSAALGKPEEILQRQISVRSLFNPWFVHVYACNKMSHIISFDLVAGLQKLYKLSVENCTSVIEIFEVDVMNTINEPLTIPNLSELRLNSLPKLTCIWRTGRLCRVLNFTNLKDLYIEDCQSMRYLLCSSALTSLVNLESILVRKCKMMEVIVKEFEDDEVEATTKLVLPNLKSIELLNINNLMGFFLGLHDFDLPSLESIIIDECPEMKTFTSNYSSTPKLEQVDINSSKYPLERDINTTLKHVQEEKIKSKEGAESEDASTS